MKLVVPKTLTILVDSREKNPLLFPKTMMWSDHRGNQRLFDIIVERRTLITGDYQVGEDEACYALGSPEACLAEKKGSLKELYDNTSTNDAPRFRRCLNRLAKATYAYLLLDFPTSQLDDDLYVKHPYEVLGKLFRAMRHRHIDLIWIPATSPAARRRLGGILLHRMWNDLWESAHQTKPVDKESTNAEVQM